MNIVNDGLSQLVAAISLFVAGQGVGVLLLILSSHHEKNTAKYLLVGYILLNCYVYIIEYCVFSLFTIPDFFIRFWAAIHLLEGGLFYLYVKALATPAFVLQWKHGLHCWPLLVKALGPASLTLLGFHDRVLTAYLSLFYYLLLIGYGIAALRLLPDYHKLLRGNFSSLERLGLGWLSKLMLAYLASSVVFFVFRGVELYAFIDNPNLQLVYVPNTLIFFILFYLIAVGGYRQPVLPLHDIVADNSGPCSDKHKPEHDDAKVDEQASASIWQALNNYMAKEQPFLDEKLSLRQLASGLEISPHHLSGVLNTHAGQSFYDFINGYRARKAAELIEKRPAMPMIEVGLEAGFASKATFYKHFKHCYSATPLQYKKHLSGKNIEKISLFESV